ncbi:MAG TPA: DNA-processing protein DprA [Alphaproteobacteria bacterium]|jgi:DNA processing protein|nr:DNA-processing protein DprA [Alphaproteobacteria bacterium]
MKISDFKIQKKDKYYFRGNWDDSIFKKSIAVVGSRRMTRYGKEVTDKFVSELVANGITTISGFMYGIDTEVHQKTIDYGGRTVAVLGCGLDVIYPPENEKLYISILENNGLIISEYEPSSKPHLWKFPQRNKVVAALASMGILVIEAGENSGSLITAKLAIKMKKKVFVVPGPITSNVSKGTNDLIKSGKGIMVTSPSDITGHKLEIENDDLKLDLSGIEEKIYHILETEALNTDEIAVQINENIVEVGTALSLMNIKGLVTESGGKFYVKNT